MCDHHNEDGSQTADVLPLTLCFGQLVVCVHILVCQVFDLLYLLDTLGIHISYHE